VTQVNLRVCRLLVIMLSSALATTACGDRSYAAMEARSVFEQATPPGSSSCWPGESRRLSFSRTTEGDVYAVRAELVNDAATKSVRIVFRAVPW
jgi:hypothetical protein